MIISNTLNIVNKNDVTLVTFDSFDRLGCVSACFSTRIGGVSEGIYSTMNLSFNNNDKPENVLENYRRICSVLSVDYKKCVFSKQTHTTNLRIVNKEDIGKGIITPLDYEDVDGLITNIPGVVLVTQYADCVPLLFCDPTKKVVASSHAGWRGTVGKIGQLTVKKMESEFGCDPKDIIVCIAPSIMQCCFEVDQPVYEHFLNIDGVNIDDICIKKQNCKYNIDLQTTNKLVLINSGIKEENITVSDICTKCHSHLFHSHRATNGKRGNNAAFISLK